MNGAKEIIVVSPDQYNDLARRLTHEISKVPGCNGAFWSIKQFEDNEFQLGGNRYVIFIGNSDENAITKDFLSVISDVKNQSGACCGFDGTKAVVFGEGKLDQIEYLKDVLSESEANAARTKTLGASMATTILVSLPISWALLGSSGVFAYKFIVLRKKKEKELRKEQTKVALNLFLTNDFDKWIGIEE